MRMFEPENLTENDLQSLVEAETIVSFRYSGKFRKGIINPEQTGDDKLALRLIQNGNEYYSLDDEKGVYRQFFIELIEGPITVH